MVDDHKCVYCGSLALTRRRVSGSVPRVDMEVSLPIFSLKYGKEHGASDEAPIQYTCNTCGYTYVLVYDHGSEELIGLLEHVRTFLNVTHADPEREARRQNILANLEQYGISLSDVFSGAKCAVNVLHNRMNKNLNKALSQFRRHGGVVLDVIFIVDGETYVLRIVQHVSDDGALVYEPKGVFPFVGGHNG